jgi:hypothetical protein
MLRSQVSVTGRAPRHNRTRRSHSARAHEAPTRRAAELTGRITLGIQLESSKGPLVTGRVRLNVTRRATMFGRTWPNVPPRPIDHAIYRPSERLTGRAGLASDRTRWCKTLARTPLQQLLLTERVRLSQDHVRFSVRSLQWPPFASVSIHDDLEKISTTSVVENMHFTSTKSAKSRQERNPNPSLPLKLHRLRKCANTTKCTPSCTRVLAFSQIFSQGVSNSLDPKCKCSRIWT